MPTESDTLREKHAKVVGAETSFEVVVTCFAEINMTIGCTQALIDTNALSLSPNSKAAFADLKTAASKIKDYITERRDDPVLAAKLVTDNFVANELYRNGFSQP